MNEKVNIRPAIPEDAPDICRIYNHYLEHTPATFELVPVAEAEMRERISKILSAGYPYFVAETGRGVIGYVYLNTFRPRAAYDQTLELTIYLDKDVRGKGCGSRLFEFLLARIDRKKIHTLISGIALPNSASVALHEKFGFRQVALLKEVGRKFDTWYDVGYWQLFPDE